MNDTNAEMKLEIFPQILNTDNREEATETNQKNTSPTSDETNREDGKETDRTNQNWMIRNGYESQNME